MTRTRSPKARPLCGALATAAAFIASASVPGMVAAQSQPEANRIWAQCTLDTGAINTVQGLLDDMNNADGSNRLSDASGAQQVAFVVIYSIKENDGQPLTAGGFTGPVICRNTQVVPTISQVLQTTNIPASGSGRVDVLDFENATVLRYRQTGTTTIEKRICHSVDANSDCFNLR